MTQIVANAIEFVSIFLIEPINVETRGTPEPRMTFGRCRLS